MRHAINVIRVQVVNAADQHNILIGNQFDTRIRDDPQPNLGALQIPQDADDLAQIVCDRPNEINPPLVIRFRPMGKIQPDHIDAGGDRLTETIRVVQSWTKSCNDLCAAHRLPHTTEQHVPNERFLRTS